MKKYEALKSQRFDRNDCGVVAVALTTDTPYPLAHSLLKSQGRKDGKGCYPSQLMRVFANLGFRIRVRRNEEVLKKDGYRCTGRTAVKSLDYLKSGVHMIVYNTHVAACINGEIEDWTNSSLKKVEEVWTLEV